METELAENRIVGHGIINKSISSAGMLRSLLMPLLAGAVAVDAAVGSSGQLRVCVCMA